MELAKRQTCSSSFSSLIENRKYTGKIRSSRFTRVRETSRPPCLHDRLLKKAWRVAVSVQV